LEIIVSKAARISIKDEFAKLSCLSKRSPESTDEEMRNSASKLSDYRDGAIFITYYDGNTEWERHPVGDEIVLVIEGQTTLILLEDGRETANELHEGEFFVVPQNIWHRFETPSKMKVWSVTPQPTDHTIDRPQDS
jgi:mannose-6-phosphate isomerase-like protein (cupin superfamily)